MIRRDLLKFGLVSALPLITSIGANGWAASPETTGGKRLVVVFLRGAVDGLSVVAPYGDPAYYQLRRSIAIPPPGSGGLIPLDNRFGLHPALGALEPLWKQGDLAFIHASGSPDATRSHFDAQHFMETGTPGALTTPDGWLNRLLAVLPGPRSSTQAIALGPTLPEILKGKSQVANMPLDKAGVRPSATDKADVARAFGRLYDGKDPLSQAYQQSQEARKEVSQAMADDEQIMANNGAPLPNGFVADAGRLARLMAKDAHIRIAFMALGGWDTHVNQGAAQGQLAGRLKPLGDGLAEFAHALGPAWSETVVLVMSEFGRTARENGNGGTDHGHGNVMWVLGGGVRGGRVYGDWPGLAPDRLWEGRDLAVTTDFRAGVGAVLRGHLKLDAQQIQSIFPAMPSTTAAQLNIMKA